jgi:hypothetical protein
MDEDVAQSGEPLQALDEVLREDAAARQRRQDIAVVGGNSLVATRQHVVSDIEDRLGRELERPLERQNVKRLALA